MFRVCFFSKLFDNNLKWGRDQVEILEEDIYDEIIAEES